MNFRFLFAAIQLFDKNDPSLRSILFDARRRLRYANPPPAIASEAQRRGLKLLNTGNFRDLSSGWLEPGPVFFPIDLHPKTERDILKRLRWMLDCRLDAEAGDYLWEAVKEALPCRENAGRGGLYRRDLVDIATGLCTLRATRPRLFDLAMAGRLGEAKVWLGANDSDREAMRLTRMMSIVWMLFDLQIVSYRLFRAEFVALDQPLTEARYLTLSAIEKEFTKLENNALKCKAAFESGKSKVDLPKSLQDFLKESDLWAIARAHLCKLHLVQPDHAQVLAEVQRMLNRTAKWSRRLQRLWTSRRMAFALSFNKVTKSNFEIDLAPMPQARAADAGSSSTAIQFGAPSVTLLLFAVTEAVEDLSRQPGHIKPDRAERLQVGKGRSLLSKRASQRLIAGLFTAYRDLYARPVNSRRVALKKNAATARNHAIKARERGQPEIGLEPMPANPLDYELGPFYFGMPAGRLLAPGTSDDDPSLMPSPDSYAAKPVDTGTRGKGAAIRDRLSNNPMALDRIDTIRIQFKTRNLNN